MKSEKIKSELLRSYLLDDVSEKQMLEIEESFLEDDSLFEELEALEDELYFDYKQNRLNARENYVFEKKFLNTAKDREKAEFATAFLETSNDFVKVEKENKESVSIWQSITSLFNTPMQFGIAAASLLLIGSLGVIVYLNLNSGNDIANLPDDSNENLNKQIIVQDDKRKNEIREEPIELTKDEEQKTSPKQEIPEQIPTSKPKRELAESKPKPKKENIEKPKKVEIPKKRQPSFIALVLSPGNFSRSGGDGMKRVKLTHATKNLLINLQIKDAEDFTSFRAVLKTVNEGTQVWSSPQLKIRGKGKNKSSSINIPTTNLKQTDYEISLVGTNENDESEEIYSYYFSVLK